jgi:hypothetical protein
MSLPTVKSKHQRWRLESTTIKTNTDVANRAWVQLNRTFLASNQIKEEARCRRPELPSITASEPSLSRSAIIGQRAPPLQGLATTPSAPSHRHCRGWPWGPSLLPSSVTPLQGLAAAPSAPPRRRCRGWSQVPRRHACPSSAAWSCPSMLVLERVAGCLGRAKE